MLYAAINFGFNLLVIIKSDSRDFFHHSYDYRPNWTPLGPITKELFENQYKPRMVLCHFFNWWRLFITFHTAGCGLEKCSCWFYLQVLSDKLICSTWLLNLIIRIDWYRSLLRSESTSAKISRILKMLIIIL